MAFTATERSYWKLIKDGYLYILQKNMVNDFTSWECVIRRKGHCKARVKLDPNDDFVEWRINTCIHLVNPTVKLQKWERQYLRGVSEGAVINLPVVENLCRNIRSAHQKRILPPLSINIAAILVLPIEFQVTTSGMSVWHLTAVLVLLINYCICISSSKTAACSIGKFLWRCYF